MENSELDCLYHDLLIAKLHACGFDKNILKLVYSYLKEKEQRVKIDNICIYIYIYIYIYMYIYIVNGKKYLLDYHKDQSLVHYALTIFFVNYFLL